MEKGKGIVSEKLLKVKLTELTKIRVVCRSCKTGCDIPIAQLDRKEEKQRNRHKIRCPGCGAEIRLDVAEGHAPLPDAYDRLAEAWQCLALVTGFDIEFVVLLPDQDSSK